jgi:hypothetical protein
MVPNPIDFEFKKINKKIIKDQPIMNKTSFSATRTRMLVYPNNTSAYSSNIYIKIDHEILSKQS